MKKSWFWLLLLLLMPLLVVAAPQNNDWPNNDPTTVRIDSELPPGAAIKAGKSEVFKAMGGKAPYSWMIVSNGSFSDALGNPVTVIQGSAVTYKAPQCSECTGTITVTDAYGNSDTTTINIVADVTPACTITPETANSFPGQGVEFKLSGNNRTVNWTADGGKAKGLGNTAIFTADTIGTYHITGTDMYDSTCSATASIKISKICQLTPQVPVIPIGSKQQFAMVGDNCSDIYWVTDVGTIDQNGMYEPPAIAGEYTITAIVNTTGHSETARITVTPECLVRPQNIHLQPEASKFFTVVSGAKPYTVEANYAIEIKQSATRVFEYVASHETGDDVVTICCSDGQVCKEIDVSINKMYINLPKEVQINDTHRFEVIGGKTEYNADINRIIFVKGTGKGTYVAPDHETIDVIEIRDGVGNTLTKSIEVKNYISPTISPKRIYAVALGDILDFSVVGGRPPFTWNYTGIGMVPKGNSATITVGGSTATSHLSVTDGTGTKSETVAVNVTLSLKITPTEYTIYKKESDTTRVRFDMSGGAGHCDWISNKQLEIKPEDKRKYHVFVTPQIINREPGTQYTVTCRDQNGEEATAIITVAKLTYDSNDDGKINDSEAQEVLKELFLDRAEVLINKMSNEELFYHFEAFLDQ